MGTQWRVVLVLWCLLGAFLAEPAANRAALAAEGERCFPETGNCISGRFRTYWEQQGGIPVFGFPITRLEPEQNRDTGQMHLTQWFEHARFELHPENPAPYDVEFNVVVRRQADRLRAVWLRQCGNERHLRHEC